MDWNSNSMRNRVGLARRATWLFFLTCGIGVGSWAPMVPYAKIRLGVDDAVLGTLLLLFGGGSLVSMPVAGILVHRLGSRVVGLVAGILIALAFPWLAVVSTMWEIGLVLFVFGAAIGAIDVAVNAQAVLVEKKSGRPLMSSFHGLYSLGGLVGVFVISGLLEVGLSLLVCAISVSILGLAIVVSQFKYLLSHTDERGGPLEVSVGTQKLGGNLRPRVRIPHGAVLLLGVLCFICFLTEGAILDWSAVFLRFNRGFDMTIAGLGYAAFSVMMAVGRLTGDRLVVRFGAIKMVRWGALLAAAGFFIAVMLPWRFVGILGFAIVGLGASNVVPVLFSTAGRLPGYSPTVSIPAVTTMGYSGLLIGPAAIGYIAHVTGLPIALSGVGILMLLVAVMATKVIGK